MTSDRPDVSVVVVAWDMPGELPRTLASLSPSMQRGMAAGSYEVIVVDNGSDPPAIVPHEPW
jgi:glycosyltransferase involved in cell wall biosynthesis